MIRRKDEERARLDRLESSMDELRHALERVELMFLMKDPSVPAGADAYEGLRRSLIVAREDRMTRLVDLARIDASLQRADGEGGTDAILRELLIAAGVERIDMPSGGAAGSFEVFGSDDDGLELVVLEPAYVHAESGALIRMGRARFESVPQSPALAGDAGEGDDSVVGRSGSTSDESEPEAVEHAERSSKGTDGASTASGSADVEAPDSDSGDSEPGQPELDTADAHEDAEDQS